MQEILTDELCRREGIHPAVYYDLLKYLKKRGKKHLAGDTQREATARPSISCVRKLNRGSNWSRICASPR